MFNGKVSSIRGIKSGKRKKHQINHRIDDSLQHTIFVKRILTFIKLLQENFQYIKTLIKKFSQFNFERKVPSED